MIDLKNKQIILFDGVCNLCANSVQFIIKKNNTKNILFASLQSAIGQEILQHFNLSQTQFNSFVFVDDAKLFLKSKAALKVAKYLNNPWKCFGVFIFVPPFIRDGIYNLIAKNRYKWFGEKNECWLPTPELKARFLN